MVEQPDEVNEVAYPGLIKRRRKIAIIVSNSNYDKIGLDTLNDYGGHEYIKRAVKMMNFDDQNIYEL